MRLVGSRKVTDIKCPNCQNVPILETFRGNSRNSKGLGYHMVETFVVRCESCCRKVEGVLGRRTRSMLLYALRTKFMRIETDNSSHVVSRVVEEGCNGLDLINSTKSMDIHCPICKSNPTIETFQKTDDAERRETGRIVVRCEICGHTVEASWGHYNLARSIIQRSALSEFERTRDKITVQCKAVDKKTVGDYGKIKPECEGCDKALFQQYLKWLPEFNKARGIGDCGSMKSVIYDTYIKPHLEDKKRVMSERGKQEVFHSGNDDYVFECGGPVSLVLGISKDRRTPAFSARPGRAGMDWGPRVDDWEGTNT